MDTCCDATALSGRACDRPPGHTGLHQVIRNGVLEEQWQARRPFPPFSNSTTSREAAEQIAPEAWTIRDRVYNAILIGEEFKEKGATADQIERFLELSGNTVRPRIRELVKAGKVYDSGETRRLASGRRAIIWRAR